MAENNQRNNSGRRDQAPAEPKQFEELVLNVDRVSRVVKGGRRFRFKALVAVGDGKTKIGVGVAKGADVQAAVAKATNVAKKQMVTIAVSGGTIAHEAEVRYTGAQVLLKPAAPGTGIIAGGVIRSIIGLTGIRDLLTKSLGSTNKVNIAYATIKALVSIVPKDQWLNTKKKSVKTEVVAETVVIEAPVVTEPKAKTVKKAVAKKPAAKKVKETK
ncbi:MAG: 30S ribosomal protein S5 [Candidatus Saccharibacteria bacterium]